MWHCEKVHAHLARGIVATLENIKLQLAIPGLRCLRDYGYLGLSDHCDGICHGHNSGYQAMQLSVLLGARRIILLGFDMKAAADGRMHWHEDHPVKTPGNVFTQTMLPAYKTIVGPLKERGIDVINCSPDSVLNCFAKMPLEEALCITA